MLNVIMHSNATLYLCCNISQGWRCSCNFCQFQTLLKAQITSYFCNKEDDILANIYISLNVGQDVCIYIYIDRYREVWGNPPWCFGGSWCFQSAGRVALLSSPKSPRRSLSLFFALQNSWLLVFCGSHSNICLATGNF